MTYRGPQPVKERFLTHVVVDLDNESRCWLWTARTARRRYGYFFLENKERIAHRVAYEMWIGPIPEGLDLDHLCRNTLCVNPAHLEPVTRRENLLRGNGFVGKQARRTHCHKGHPLSGSNLRIAISKNGSRHRQCHTCDLERYRARYQRRKQRALEAERATEAPGYSPVEGHAPAPRRPVGAGGLNQPPPSVPRAARSRLDSFLETGVVRW